MINKKVWRCGCEVIEVEGSGKPPIKWKLCAQHTSEEKRKALNTNKRKQAGVFSKFKSKRGRQQYK
jgi:hypothetical protein